VALADRKRITPPPPIGWSNEEGWRIEWAKGVIVQARAQLGEGAPMADAIMAAMDGGTEKLRALGSRGRP
jgi:hypothetical protein